MAYQVLNQLTFTGPKEEVQKLMGYVATEESEFDFNTIVPMPSSLYIVSGAITDKAIAYYLYKERGETEAIDKLLLKYSGSNNTDIKTHDDLCAFLLDSNPNIYEIGQKYVFNIDNYGYPTFSEWCLANWENKSNAFNAYAEDNCIEFYTPDSPVLSLVKKLSQIFPLVRIDYQYAGLAYELIVGVYVIAGGEIVSSYEPEGSEGRIEFAKKLLGDDFLEDDEDDEDE